MGTVAKLLSAEGETVKSQIEELGGEEVLAAGQLRQGRQPSLLAMVTGTALISLARRPARELPRHFALALTRDRLVAYACIGVSDEDGDDFHVVVRDGERGSWPRGAVSFSGTPEEGVLAVDGREVPVFQPRRDEDAETPELLEALAR